MPESALEPEHSPVLAYAQRPEPRPGLKPDFESELEALSLSSKQLGIGLADLSGFRTALAKVCAAFVPVGRGLSS